MKRISISLAALVASCTFSDSLLAHACVDVDADAHIVGGGDGDKNLGNEAKFSVGMDTKKDDELVKANKAYIRFDITGLTIGATPTLNLTLESAAPNRSPPGGEHIFNLWGLVDGGSEPANTGDYWVETGPGGQGAPLSDGITWNNAPANDTGSYSEMLTAEVYGGAVLNTFTIPDSAQAGDTISIPITNGFAFLDSDTNGLVTFIITPSTSTSLKFSNHLFIAKEGVDLAATPPKIAPQLFLNTPPPTPEPSSLVLCGIAALCLGGYSAARRRFARPK